MKKLLVLAVLLLFLVISPTISSTLKKNALHKKTHILNPYKNNLFEITLTKRELPPHQKAEFIAQLAELHKNIRANKDEKAGIFLEKTATSTTSIHQIPVENYKNLQVSFE
jgi:ABC-type transport system involved in cytochrome bd biosynthesis fused ATPase/permease subunit